MKAIIFILLILSCLYHPSIAQDNALENKSFQAIEKTLDPVSAIVTSQLVWSEKVNDEFKINISLPPNYDSLRLEKYPVVYFLDGGINTFHNINLEYMSQGLIPEVITIGIGYPGATQRNRDYTYGFIDFYMFLKQELIPKMDKKYHIDTLSRTLFGHSYGGICVLFNLFQYYHWEDILFSNLIAASPSIWYDEQVAFSRERSLYDETHILPVNLYMTVGSMEGFMVTDLQRMEHILRDHNYEYLNLTSHVNQEKDHSSNKEFTYREGIQWILSQEIRIPTITRPGLLSQPAIATGIYPNPATDYINLMISPSVIHPITYSIKDMNGREVKNLAAEHAEQQLLHIPVTSLSKGVYVIKLTDGTRQQTLKFIK